MQVCLVQVKAFVRYQIIAVLVHLRHLHVDVAHRTSLYGLYLGSATAYIGYFEVRHAFGEFYDLIAVDTVVGCQVPAEIFGQYRSGANGDVPALIGYFSHIHQYVLHARRRRLGSGKYLVFHTVVVVRYVETQTVVEELAFESYFVLILFFGADVGVTP